MKLITFLSIAIVFLILSGFTKIPFGITDDEYKLAETDTVIKYNKSNGNYVVTLPFGYPRQADINIATIDSHTHFAPNTSLLLEYGDGDFSTRYEPTHHFDMSALGIGAAGRDTALAFTRRYYDTTRRPEEFVRIYIPAPTGTVSAYNSVLTGSEKLKLLPACYTFRPEENTGFVLSYISRTGFLSVFYNGNMKPSLFGAIANEGSTTVISGQRIKDVRVNKNQRVFTSVAGINASSLGEAQKTAMRTMIAKHTDFKNFFFVTVTENTLRKKNIFFTLPPIALSVFESFSLRDSLSRLSAFYSDWLPSGRSDSSSITMRLTTLPHDPNFMSVYPSCVDSIQGGITLPKQIAFNVHFQNTGVGPVTTRMKVKLYLPKGLMNTVAVGNANLGDKNFYTNNSTVNGTTFSYAKYISFTRAYLWDTLVFTFTNPNLAGIMGTPNSHLSPLTQGNLNFTLSVNSYSRLPIFTYADIYFDQEAPVRMSSKVCDCAMPDCVAGPFNIPPAGNLPPDLQ